MRAPGIAVAALALTGCATLTPPAEVIHPVAVSCLPAAMPARPVVASDAQLAAMDDGRLVLTLRRDALALAAYAGEIEAVLGACR